LGVVSEVVVVSRDSTIILIIVLFILTTRIALGVFLLCAAAGSHAVDALLDEVAENLLLLCGSSGFAKADDKFWSLRVQVGPESPKGCSRKMNGELGVVEDVEKVSI
jgi:hypothetical protein